MAIKKSASVAVDTKEIEVYKKQLANAENFSTTLKVESDGDYQLALTEGKLIKDQLEIIVARKEEITKPLNAALKSVRELFRPLESVGETALKTIKSKMIAYSTEKDRKAEEIKQKLAERVERGTMKPETAVAKIDAIKERPKTVSTDVGSATTKTVTKYRITDITKVPVQFLEVDMVKVKASFRAGTPVPGVEAYEDKELSFGN